MAINLVHPWLTELERSYLLAAFDSQWISSIGEFTDRVESLDLFTGRTQNLLVSNGTDALELALKTLLDCNSAVVLCPTVTFSATANAIINTGHTPVFYAQTLASASIEPDYLAIESYLESHLVHALVLVHLYGECCDLVKARTFCQKHNLVLIEDCAEAPLSHDKSGLLCGSVGDAATFSFFANKLITCGEGGLISFRDESLLSKAKAIRSHGMSSRGIYEYDYVGSNYRLTNLHASILFGQCERISEILSTRFSLLELYSNYLCGMWTLLPRAIGQSKPSPWFSIVVPKDTNSHLVTMKSGELATAGIQHRRLFLPLHLSKPYLHYPRIVSSTAVVIDGFMLPLHYKLTGAEIQSICDILNYGL